MRLLLCILFLFFHHHTTHHTNVSVCVRACVVCASLVSLPSLLVVCLSQFVEDSSYSAPPPSLACMHVLACLLCFLPSLVCVHACLCLLACFLLDARASCTLRRRRLFMALIFGFFTSFFSLSGSLVCTICSEAT